MSLLTVLFWLTTFIVTDMFAIVYYTHRHFNVESSSLADEKLFVHLQDAAAPMWRSDSEALWGRLIELGGIAGLHTDSECLLLKDLCTSGIEDDTFLGLLDFEIQVT